MYYVHKNNTSDKHNFFSFCEQDVFAEKNKQWLALTKIAFHFSSGYKSLKFSSFYHFHQITLRTIETTMKTATSTVLVLRVNIITL